MGSSRSRTITMGTALASEGVKAKPLASRTGRLVSFARRSKEFEVGFIRMVG